MSTNVPPIRPGSRLDAAVNAAEAGLTVIDGASITWRGKTGLIKASSLSREWFDAVFGRRWVLTEGSGVSFLVRGRTTVRRFTYLRTNGAVTRHVESWEFVSAHGETVFVIND